MSTSVICLYNVGVGNVSFSAPPDITRFDDNIIRATQAWLNYQVSMINRTTGSNLEDVPLYLEHQFPLVNSLTPNELQRRGAVSPLKIKIPSIKSRQAALRGRI
jgi:hypothetical protein